MLKKKYKVSVNTNFKYFKNILMPLERTDAVIFFFKESKVKISILLNINIINGDKMFNYLK